MQEYKRISCLFFQVFNKNLIWIRDCVRDGVLFFMTQQKQNLCATTDSPQFAGETFRSFFLYCVILAKNKNFIASRVNPSRAGSRMTVQIYLMFSTILNTRMNFSGEDDQNIFFIRTNLVNSEIWLTYFRDPFIEINLYMLHFS